jgi:hypothetical protein
VVAADEQKTSERPRDHSDEWKTMGRLWNLSGFLLKAGTQNWQVSLFFGKIGVSLHWHGGIGLKDVAGNFLAGVALRVRTATFQIDAAALVDIFLREAEGRTAMCDAVVEHVNEPRRMQAGQAQVVVRAMDGDVLDFELV